MAGEETKPSRAARVWKNLKQGMELAYAASPKLLVRYSALGIINATMTPLSVWLGSVLVNQIADRRPFEEMIPILAGLWAAAAIQRALGAYM